MEIKLSKEEIKDLVGETNFKEVVSEIAREELFIMIKNAVENFFVSEVDDLKDNLVLQGLIENAIAEIIRPEVRGVFTSMDLRDEFRESAEKYTIKMLDKVDIDSRINGVIRQVVSEKLLEQN